uniref:Uncharacterized protein n=1 Tax=Hucho hucho TaxID=62062 RepID=A0A4W5KZ89_9TELE
DLYPSILLSRLCIKPFRDHTEQQHIAAQQETALQDAHAHSSVLPQLEPPSPAE